MAAAIMANAAELTAKETAVVDIGAWTACGEQGKLGAAFKAGFDAGLTLNEAKELVGQLYAYCGFPRALNAAGTLMKVAKDVNPVEGRGNSPFKADYNALRDGTANQTKLCGGPVKGELFDFHPQLDEYLKAHLFGDVFQRDTLDWRTRELVTIAALAARPETEPQMKAHVAIGKVNGITDAQANAILQRVQRSGDSAELAQDWDKTFPRSDKVAHAKATFKNRFGITLAADVYKPKTVNGKLAAIAVSGPFGAVKEQASGLYAQTLAERGFLAIAFDPSFTGESGGEPRYVASPDINTEDFQAAVDYIASRDDVDAERIGILGICGWGGLAINAAAVDTRVKATVASTMYDMTRVTANGYFDSEDSAAARKSKKVAMNAQRLKDFKSGSYEVGGGVPDRLPDDAPEFVRRYYDYYKTPRGYHPRSLNSNGGWNKTSALSFINAKLLAYAGEIENAVMVVHGEKAHSRYFGETAFKMLKGDNKELVIVPDADHTDLYDGGGKNAIPFDRIEAFYRKNLSQAGRAAKFSAKCSAGIG